MISKQIFFIWLGDKPNYVDFAVKTFKEVNPDYKVDLMEYTIDQINNREVDDDLKSAINYCLKDSNKNMRFIQRLANVYRFNLLRKYGGIYLDADTFPIKPFDDKLLEKSFDVTRSYVNDEFIFKDIFFIGREKDFKTNRGTVLLYPHNTCSKFDSELIYKNFLELKRKFFECSLKYGEHFGDIQNNYIDHYNDYSWNPKECRTPFCKFDEEEKQ